MVLLKKLDENQEGFSNLEKSLGLCDHSLLIIKFTTR